MTMEFAWKAALSGICLGGVAGWIIASFTFQLPMRWNHFMRIEARECLGITDNAVPPPPLLILRKKVCLRSTVIVLLCVVETILAITAKGIGSSIIPLLVFAYGLTAAAIVDHEHMILPDSIVQPLLWSGLVYVAILLPTDLQSHVLGAAVGYCLLRWLPGVGEGDAKLCAATGAWIGLSALPLLLVIGGGLGVASALIYFWRRRKSAACPFGPPLALAALTIMTADALGLSTALLG